MKVTQHVGLAGKNPFIFMHNPNYNGYADYTSQNSMVILPASRFSVGLSTENTINNLPCDGYSVNKVTSRSVRNIPISDEKVTFGM